MLELFIRATDAPQARLLLPIAGFLAGLLLGHWLQLGRDRRIEINAAARPIREALLAELAAPSAYRRLVDDAELDHFLQHLRPRHRRAFEADLCAYQQSKQERITINTVGDVLLPPLDDPQRKRLERLLARTHRR